MGERGKFPTWLIGPYAPCTNNKRRKRRGKKRGRLGCQQYWDVTCPLSRSSIVLPLGKMGKEKIHFHQNKPKKKKNPWWHCPFLILRAVSGRICIFIYCISWYQIRCDTLYILHVVIYSGVTLDDYCLFLFSKKEARCQESNCPHLYEGEKEKCHLTITLGCQPQTQLAIIPSFLGTDLLRKKKVKINPAWIKTGMSSR